ncbi:hypothetical protein chiPu_0001954 [Chiloscyllium punctatum]|uniref:Uncharacterized protein n=1 Tax=Chiloscyllium punctatum TaxID=137246 RepID=A0A401RZG2_CHIPU|nr:hypothetical protein [Chiloscyllium punctatum]
MSECNGFRQVSVLPTEACGRAAVATASPGQRCSTQKQPVTAGRRATRHAQRRHEPRVCARARSLARAKPAGREDVRSREARLRAEPCPSLGPGMVGWEGEGSRDVGPGHPSRWRLLGKLLRIWRQGQPLTALSRRRRATPSLPDNQPLLSIAVGISKETPTPAGIAGVGVVTHKRTRHC